MPPVLPIALPKESLELGEGDRIARHPERRDGSRQAVNNLRDQVIGIGADLDRHLAAVDRDPVDVRQAVGA